MILKLLINSIKIFYKLLTKDSAEDYLNAIFYKMERTKHDFIAGCPVYYSTSQLDLFPITGLKKN